MSSLKLPLRVLPGSIGTGFIAVADADGHLIDLTEHHAKVIVAALGADAEKEKDWLAESRRAFTCPECGGHWFGTSGAGDDDRSNWVVHCHRQYGPCIWSGPYEEHVRNDHVEPNAEKEVQGE